MHVQVLEKLAYLSTQNRSLNTNCTIRSKKSRRIESVPNVESKWTFNEPRSSSVLRMTYCGSDISSLFNSSPSIGKRDFACALWADRLQTLQVLMKSTSALNHTESHHASQACCFGLQIRFPKMLYSVNHFLTKPNDSPKRVLQNGVLATHVSTTRFYDVQNKNRLSSIQG